MKSSKKNFITIQSHSSEDYKKVLRNIQKENFCPFCEKNLMLNHKKPILFKTKYWIVTENSWPYKATRKHFLMIYRPNHLCHIDKLPVDAALDKLKIEKKLCKQFKIKGGTVMMRFGLGKDTGATVEHLHFHIIVPDKKSKDYNQEVGVLARVG